MRRNKSVIFKNDDQKIQQFLWYQNYNDFEKNPKTSEQAPVRVRDWAQIENIYSVTC